MSARSAPPSTRASSRARAAPRSRSTPTPSRQRASCAAIASRSRSSASGEVSATLFVLADAFTKSAREKIEAAGGTAQVIEIPSEPLAALGVEPAAVADAADNG